MQEIQSIGAQTAEWIVHPGACPPLTSHGLEMCGWSHALPGFHFERQAWNLGQILVSLDDGGEWMVDGKWTPALAGTALICPAGVPHRYRCVAATGWNVAWCIFDPASSATIMPAVDVHVVTCDRRQLSAAIEGCYRECLAVADPEILDRWVGLVRSVAVRIARNGQMSSRLAHVWAAVDAAPAHSWTLAELVELAGVGDEHLRRLCRKEFARSPMAQVTWLRMRRAQALLGTGHSVTATAELVGYTDPFAFSAAFKRTMGQPPSRVASAG